jgi:hypothetical protein
MTLNSAAYDLQVALVGRIEAALPDWNVSEKPRKNQPPPYIEIASVDIISTIQTKTTTIEKLRATINVWDESENSDAVKDAIDDIRAAITSTNIVLDNGFFNYLQIHERTVPSALQRDRRTWKGSTIFQFNIRQA